MQSNPIILRIRYGENSKIAELRWIIGQIYAGTHTQFSLRRLELDVSQNQAFFGFLGR